jgi:glycosyltransferase involved in cell wall biosynthesis
MATYNRAHTILDAVSSVIDQIYPHWELIIVDDGSSDGTENLIREIQYEEPRIHYIKSEHVGVSHARNIGLEAAKGDIIAYLDSDNEWSKDCLLYFVHYILARDCQCVYAGQDLQEGGKCVGVRFKAFDIERIVVHNFIDLNVFAHTRNLYESLGGFDETLRRTVDWDLILRYVKHHPPIPIPAVLGRYCDDSVTDRITIRESSGYIHVVRNRHMIDWADLDLRAFRVRKGAVSILVPAVNESPGEMTDDWLKALIYCTRDNDCEIIIPLNGCLPSTASMVRKYASEQPRVRYVNTRGRWNRALALNLGLEACTGEFVVIMDKDVTLSEDCNSFPHSLTRPLKEDSSVGMTAAKILDWDETLLLGPIKFESDTHTVRTLYAGLARYDPVINAPKSCHVLADTCCALRFQDLVSLRGISPFYSDDTRFVDLSFRVRQYLGKDLIYSPDCEVHFHGIHTWVGMGSDIHDKEALSDIVTEQHQPQGTSVLRTGQANIQHLRIGIKIPVPRRDCLQEWGDYHFAMAIKRTLQRRGHMVRIDILPEWYNSTGNRDDAVIVLRGLEPYETRPSAVNVLWNISHPELLKADELNRFDYVFTASEIFADQLARSINTPVAPLLQCTDPEVFYPDENHEVEVPELLFVGNSRKQFRRIIKDAVHMELPVAVYGTLWEPFIEKNLIKGEHIDNRKLRWYYSKCSIVFNDHWDDMRELGFLSNRLFDAGACGALIISDAVKGLPDVFGDTIITYETPEDLATIVRHYRSDEAMRKEIGNKLRHLVVSRHTFDHRADIILSNIQALLRLRVTSQ